MTKKDVLEIRHLFAPKECSISKIRGCYVDGDCNKVATINEQFLTMPEEETYKYFEILRKIVPHKNILNGLMLIHSFLFPPYTRLVKILSGS